ncbi:MAG TPA: TIGR03085 family metal-binding protein [Streptosporangiaceae bacterium]|nr:TIGR03085 family metal-binding protein [Streptosporangiaceae bacterium]
MTYARDERLAVCDLLDKLGPDQPTLCAGWRTADLAAHLVLRERRPDAALGVVGGPLAGHTRRVQARLLEKEPFGRLVERIRTGPPRGSVFAIRGADARLNAVEYFVHHEDVRRAQPDWQPRDLDAGLSDLLWRQLRSARLMLRKAPVGVEFAREGAGETAASSDPGAPVRITAKGRAPMVTVAGPPAELTMWAFGRARSARVRLIGSDPDVAALASPRWRS